MKREMDIIKDIIIIIIIAHFYFQLISIGMK